MEWRASISEPTLREAGVRGAILFDEPMAKHVTWRAGGRAAMTFRPRDRADLECFLGLVGAPLRQHPPVFVGLGSNLLIRDGGLDAVVVFTHPGLSRLELLPPTLGSALVYAEAGVAAPKLARFAANHALANAEFMAGIPGTVGGALAMNAGCYGSETWEHVETVQVINLDGRCEQRRVGDYQIGYRQVVPRDRHRSEWFVAGSFRFQRGDAVRARERIKSLLAQRVATQPLQSPNAGSVFRNPPGDYAARLIERCGLKGEGFGGALVSEKHANFIVNTGQARAADIEALVEHVRATVERQTGVLLEPEVRIIGKA